MGPKPRPRPEKWSLEKAKQANKDNTSFETAPPKLAMPKERKRSEDGKFEKGKKK